MNIKKWNSVDPGDPIASSPFVFKRFLLMNVLDQQIVYYYGKDCYLNEEVNLYSDVQKGRARTNRPKP